MPSSVLVVASCKPVVSQIVTRHLKNCVPIVAQYVFLRRQLCTRSHPSASRRTPFLDPSAPFRCALTYKCACTYRNLYTLHEHPSLHLPQQFIEGFLAWCYTTTVNFFFLIHFTVGHYRLKSIVVVLKDVYVIKILFL